MLTVTKPTIVLTSESARLSARAGTRGEHLAYVELRSTAATPGLSVSGEISHVNIYVPDTGYAERLAAAINGAAEADEDTFESIGEVAQRVVGRLPAGGRITRAQRDAAVIRMAERIQREAA